MKFIELRYPFESFTDFYANGYWSDPQGLHLVFGQFLVFSALLFFFVRFLRHFPFVLATSAVVTSFMISPSLVFAGLFLSDWLLVGSAVLALFTLTREKFPKIGWWCFCFLIFTACHSLLVFKIYGLGDSAQLLQRVLLVMRPFAVLFCLSFLFRSLWLCPDTAKVFKQMLFTMLLISSATYIAQFVIYKNGVIPFGTFASAGFGGGVRFGGLANEGGHLAKLAFPLLALSSLFIQKKRDLVLVAFFTLIFLANPSASGYAFFACFALAAGCLILLRSLRFGSWKIFAVASGVAGLGVAAFIYTAATNSVFAGLVGKINHSITVMSNPDLDIYGRSPAIALKVLSNFPLGVGYGGSAQRNLAARLSGVRYGESNLGINVLVESLSMFAIVPIVLLVTMLTHLTYLSIKNRRLGVIRGGLLGAVP